MVSTRRRCRILMPWAVKPWSRVFRKFSGELTIIQYWALRPARDPFRRALAGFSAGAASEASSPLAGEVAGEVPGEMSSPLVGEVAGAAGRRGSISREYPG